jgi:hypothetical protein
MISRGFAVASLQATGQPALATKYLVDILGRVL